jgi:hypothetical protein
VEIADDAVEADGPAALEPDSPHAVLLCHFVDASGAPVAGEKVEAIVGGAELELHTDENGRIEAPARLDAYQLKIRGQSFTAHALPAADREKDENLYRFVLKNP